MIDLSKLDPTEKKEAIELLTKMGYNIEGDILKPQRKPKVKLKSYICRYEISCNTCKHIYFESYIMTPDVDHKYLFSRPIKEKDIRTDVKIETHTKETVTCSSCLLRLCALDKIDLAKMILKEKQRWI